MDVRNVYDVIVVGGGVVGASSAWRLAQSGRRVLLLERRKIGSEASGAAAGMLGAQLEVGSPGPFYHLCIESRNKYPNFAEALLDETGIDVQLVQNGILRLAYNSGEVNELEKQRAWQTEVGCRAQWWNEDTLTAAEPTLAASLGALLLPDDGNLSAPLLTQALGVAAVRNVEVMEDTEVQRITPSAQQVRVDTVLASYVAEHVVIAAGAWAKVFLSQVGVASHIYPVKGQMMAIRPRHGMRLHHTVFSRHAYLVPKRDGTIVVGATEDHHAGFNRDVTVGNMAFLTSALERMAPGLNDSIVVRSWTGLRPGSPTGLPLIGPVPGTDRVILAAGHFRNGILLAPITAEMILKVLSREVWPEVWRAFLPTVSDLRART